jgi:tetratricopeptide (TPR) repeat protein
MDASRALGSRLRRFRLAAGMTQADLAAPKYSHAYVSTIEAGRRHPSRRALEHFAAKLSVDPEQLETGRRSDLEPSLELRLHEARLALSAGSVDIAEDEFAGLVKLGRRHGLPRIAAKAECGLGLAQERRGRSEAALDHYRSAEEILGGDTVVVRTEAIAGKARAFQALGDIRHAIHLLESHADALRRDDLVDPVALMHIHASLLDAYLDAGLYRPANETSSELERLAPAVRDPMRLAQMHVNLARLHLSHGRPRDAEASLQRAEDVYQQLELKTESGYTSLARGYVFSRDGKLPRARSELRRAAELFEETGDSKHLARALNELGRVERLSGNAEEAARLLDRSIGLLGDEDVPILAWAHRELGVTLADIDDGVGEKHLREAIELFTRAEQGIEAAVAYRMLGDLLSARGESDAGCDAYRTGIVSMERWL